MNIENRRVLLFIVLSQLYCGSDGQYQCSCNLTKTEEATTQTTSRVTVATTRSISTTTQNCSDSCPEEGYASNFETCSPPSQGLKCFQCSSYCKTCTVNELDQCTSCRFRRVGYTISFENEQNNSAVTPTSAYSALNDSMTQVELQNITVSSNCTADLFCSRGQSCPENTKEFNTSQLGNAYKSEVVCLCECPQINGFQYILDGNECVKECPQGQKVDGKKCVDKKSILAAAIGGAVGGTVALVVIGLAVGIPCYRIRDRRRKRRQLAREQRKQQLFEGAAQKRHSSRYATDPTANRPESVGVYENSDNRPVSMSSLPEYANFDQIQLSMDRHDDPDIQQNAEDSEGGLPLYTNSAFAEQIAQQQNDDDEEDYIECNKPQPPNDYNGETYEIFNPEPQTHDAAETAVVSSDEEPIYGNEEIIQQHQQQHYPQDTYEVVGSQ